MAKSKLDKMKEQFNQLNGNIQPDKERANITDLMSENRANLADIDISLTPIEPQPLDPVERQRINAERANGVTSSRNGEKVTRRYLKAKLNNRQRGKKAGDKVQTIRASFEITPEIRDALDKRVLELRLEGIDTNKSEIVRHAIITELGRI